MRKYLLLGAVFYFTFANSIAGAGLKIDKKELKNLPASHKIEGVRPIKQGPNQCGPTSIAMVLNFWGVEITRDDIWPEVKSPYGWFTNCFDVQTYFRRRGFTTKVLQTSNYSKLKYFLSKGYPLIAYAEPRMRDGTAHYIVLTGYDDKGFYIVDPGPGRSLFMP